MLEATGAQLEADYALLRYSVALQPDVERVLEAYNRLGDSMRRMVKRSRELGVVYDDEFHADMHKELARLKKRS